MFIPNIYLNNFWWCYILKINTDLKNVRYDSDYFGNCYIFLCSFINL